MEKSRSLFQQVIAHKMLFVVFLLFPTDILIEGQNISEVTDPKNMSTIVNTTASNISTSLPPVSPKVTAKNSMTSVTSPPDATMHGILSGSVNTSVQPASSLRATPPVSKQELHSSTVVKAVAPEDTSSPMPSDVMVSIEGKKPHSEAPPVSKQELHSSTVVKAVAPEDTSSPMPSDVTVSIEGKKPHSEAPPVSKQELHSSTVVKAVAPEDTSSPMPSNVTVSTEGKKPHSEAAEVRESTTSLGQKEVSSKMTVTPHFDSEKASSPAKDFGTRSQGSFSEQSSSAIAYTEATKSTEPKQGRKGPIPPRQAVTELTQTPETSSQHPSGPFTTLVTSITNASESVPFDQISSERKHSVIILVVIVSILLIVGLLAFLYFRRRRHSGSTSFNAPEWPGQARLPDDTGLDKDMEQQAGAVGEGEARRGTLVTFFGKRQSRVPSIAMEDMNGKGGKGETEQLLSGESETGSTSQATGDANGKVPEPLKKSS